MKKLVLGLAIVLSVGAVATSAMATTGGTVVYSGFACGLLDGNGNFISTNNSTTTLYDSGKVVMKCNGNGAGAPSLTYFNYDNTGLVCGTQFGSTTDWTDKVGRNGNSQLTCTLWLSGDDAAPASAGAGLG